MNTRHEKAALAPDDSTLIPPHCPGDEKAVLGGCILAPFDCAPAAIESLGTTLEPFFSIEHQEVWRAIVALTDAGKPCDALHVIQWLKEHKTNIPVPFVAELPDCIAAPSMLAHHIDKMLDCWRRRRIIKACVRAIECARAYADCESYLDRIAAEVATVDRHDGDEECKPPQFLRRYVDALEARHALNGALPGMPTGFYDLDSKEGGLRLKEMLILGARPFEGKTALACQIAERVCLQDGQPTLFISLEMTREKLMDRFTALAGVNIHELSKGALTERHFEQIAFNNGRVRKSPLFIVERTGGMTSTEVASCIRRYARQHGIKLVIIDYLQKITADGRHEKTTYGIGDTCKRLRHCAVSAGLSLLALAQLNRDIDKGKGNGPRLPRMSDLADSKAIEAEADTVILLAKEDERNRTLFVPKSRNSGGCIVNLAFDPETLRFHNKTK